MMRWTDKQLAEHIAKNTPQTSHVAAVTHLVVPDKQGIGVAPAKGVKGLKLDSTQKKRVVIVLEGKLPTWNNLLSANRWQRMKIRHEIHERVFTFIRNAGGLPTLMGSQEKP